MKGKHCCVNNLNQVMPAAMHPDEDEKEQIVEARSELIFSSLTVDFS